MSSLFLKIGKKEEILDKNFLFLPLKSQMPFPCRQRQLDRIPLLYENGVALRGFRS